MVYEPTISIRMPIRTAVNDTKINPMTHSNAISTGPRVVGRGLELRLLLFITGLQSLGRTRQRCPWSHRHHCCQWSHLRLLDLRRPVLPLLPEPEPELRHPELPDRY